MNHFIARFGCPLTIHSDQGRNYEADLFRELCQLMEIQKTRSSPRHSQSNGCVERFNQTLIMMIRAYLNGKPSNWDKNLGILAGAYRASVHEITKFTPNKLMLGRENRMPSDLVFGATTEDQSYGEYVTNLQSRNIIILFL